MKSMSVTEVRNRLLELADEVAKDPSRAITVTRRGRPVMALLSSELYESLMETIEILGDERLSARLRRALDEVARGDTVSWKEARKRLGIPE
jgi:prevent-host-death family protein